MKTQEIKSLLKELNEWLKRHKLRGEVGIIGGAAMCLAYKARAATKDIDAIFAPAAEIRKAVNEIAERRNIAADWLNDAAKGYLAPGFLKKNLYKWSHLSIWVPEPRYMLAMKTISARWDTSDRDDVLFLTKKLKLKSANQVFDIVENYYPKKRIPAKTKFFVEELF